MAPGASDPACRPQVADRRPGWLGLRLVTPMTLNALTMTSHAFDTRIRPARPLLILLTIVALSACGVEAVGSAASGAAVKKQEIEQGQVQKEAVQQQLQQALEQGQQRQQALEQSTR